MSFRRTDASTFQTSLRQSTLTPSHSISPIEHLAFKILEHIAWRLSLEDRANVARTCTTLQLPFTRMLYYKVSVAGVSARCFSLTIICRSPTALIGATFTRYLSLSTVLISDGFRVYSLFCQALQHLTFLRQLTISVPSPSLPILLENLYRTGVIRQSTSFILSLASPNRNRIPLNTLPHLTSLSVGDSLDLLHLLAYRNVTSVRLTAYLDLVDLDFVLRTLQEADTNKQLNAFGFRLKSHLEIGDILRGLNHCLPILQVLYVDQGGLNIKDLFDALQEEEDKRVLPHLSLLVINQRATEPLGLGRSGWVTFTTWNNYQIRFQNVGELHPRLCIIQLGPLIWHREGYNSVWRPMPSEATLDWWERKCSRQRHRSSRMHMAAIGMASVWPK